MASESVEIGMHEVRRANELVGKQLLELRDTRVPGLSIRVWRKAAVWTLRGRLGKSQSTWRIADAGILTTPKVARERAIHARSLLARGIDPKEWLAEQEHGGQVERTFDREKDGPTFAEARERYLAYVERERAAETLADYRKTLGHAKLAHLDDKLLRSIEASDVRKACRAIYDDRHKDGQPKKRQSDHVLTVIKAFFAWVAREDGIPQVTQSPVRDVAGVEVATKDRGFFEVDLLADDSAPDIQVLGETIWKLDTTAGINQPSRLAATLAILLAQRRTTILKAERTCLIVNPGDPSERLWRLPSDHMKSKLPHILPLPSLARAVFEAALACAGSSEGRWVFPQLRKFRRDDVGDGHMAARSLNTALERAGADISPHRVRHALVTHGRRMLGYDLAVIKKVLHHAEGRGPSVAEQHYDLSADLAAKRPLLVSWEHLIVRTIRETAPVGRDWPTFLPKPVESDPVVRRAERTEAILRRLSRWEPMPAQVAQTLREQD